MSATTMPFIEKRVYGELILKPLREADSVLGSESANGT